MTRRSLCALFLGLFILLVGGAFFVRMYQKDVAALVDFSAAYVTFDQAISDFSRSKTDSADEHADETLRDLDAKATFRLSSLNKNEKEVMQDARTIADLAGQELATLKDYRHRGTAPQKSMYDELSGKRKAAYVHFRSLAE